MDKAIYFIIGLGAEFMAIGISQFYPETARWTWGLFLWGGIALMAYGGYLACMTKCKIAYKKTRSE